MRLALEQIEIVIAGRVDRSETEIVSLGAYVIAITTVLEDHGGLLACSYLLDLDGRAIAADLWRGQTLRAFDHRELELAGVHCARACLLDHAAALRDRLADELDDHIRVEVPEATLSACERVWDQSATD